jgi:curved DNA-binding protein CbpA
MINLYSVLQVGPNCSTEELKSAYRRCARAAHPDHQGDAERFQRVQAAYAVLSNPDQRALYDKERRAWMRQIGAIECLGCGQANRITRRPAVGEAVFCSSCRGRLTLTLAEAMQAQRQALAHEAARLVDEVGLGLAELTAEAVRAGLQRLRLRLRQGLVRKVALAPSTTPKS